MTSDLFKPPAFGPPYVSRMTSPRPQLSAIGFVADDLPRLVAFYRRLGLDLPEQAEGHVEVRVGSFRVMFDDAAVIRSFDPDRDPQQRHALAFECKSAADVDALVAELDAEGHHVHLSPFDAPWGQRYAILLDPEGNPVDVFAALS
jgi:uncharacterized glyoxalase superfamily protein PhnB